MLRVFVSSTFGDLLDFRKAAREAARDRGWDAVMLEDPGTASAWTVDYCCQHVRTSNLLLAIVGFKRGSRPPASKGGDDIQSYTAYEVAEAERHGIPIRVLMAKENWPGDRWDRGADLEWVLEFRRQIGHKAVFFENEPVERDAAEPLPKFRMLVDRALAEHQRELDRHFRDAIDGAHAARRWPELHSALLALKPLLEEVVLLRDAVRAGYRQAHPDGLDDLPERDHFAQLLAGAVRKLAAFPCAADGSCPLLWFIDHVAAEAPDANHRARLSQWAAQAAALLAVNRPRPAPVAAPMPAAIPVEAPVAADESADQHVVIRLDPSKQSAEEYVVSAWLYQGAKPTPLRAEKEPWVNWTKKNRAALLGAIWQAARKASAAARRLVVEFVVPLSLLVEKIDQWQIHIEGLAPARIGDRCPVVLGLRERVVLDEAYKSLEDRCASVGAGMCHPCRLVDTASGATRPAALWVANPADGDSLHRALSANDAVACVVLGQPLSRAATRAGKKMNVLQAVLWTGIPILLWPREVPQSGPAALREDLKGLVDGQALDGLPRRIFKARPGTPGGATVSGSLTLVWDDPTRRRPDPDDDPPLNLEAR
jgi:hypothetical protein